MSTTTLSYRESLRAAIQELLPPELSGGVAPASRLEWTPDRVLWQALLMAYSTEPTLTDRFRATQELLQGLQPSWWPQRSYGGWIQAQGRCWQEVHRAAAEQLRQVMRQRGGRSWVWCC